MQFKPNRLVYKGPDAPPPVEAEEAEEDDKKKPDQKSVEDAAAKNKKEQEDLQAELDKYAWDDKADPALRKAAANASTQLNLLKKGRSHLAPEEHQQFLEEHMLPFKYHKEILQAKTTYEEIQKKVAIIKNKHKDAVNDFFTVNTRNFNEKNKAKARALCDELLEKSSTLIDTEAMKYKAPEVSLEEYQKNPKKREELSQQLVTLEKGLRIFKGEDSILRDAIQELEVPYEDMIRAIYLIEISEDPTKLINKIERQKEFALRTLGEKKSKKALKIIQLAKNVQALMPLEDNPEERVKAAAEALDDIFQVANIRPKGKYPQTILSSVNEQYSQQKKEAENNAS